MLWLSRRLYRTVLRQLFRRTLPRTLSATLTAYNSCIEGSLGFSSCLILLAPMSLQYVCIERVFFKVQSCLRNQKKQAWKIVCFQRHLPFTLQIYISCRIIGVPPLQSDFYGLFSALKDGTNEPKKRKETRTKPTKMARKKSTLLVQQIC